MSDLGKNEVRVPVNTERDDVTKGGGYLSKDTRVFVRDYSILCDEKLGIGVTLTVGIKGRREVCIKEVSTEYE